MNDALLKIEDDAAATDDLLSSAVRRQLEALYDRVPQVSCSCDRPGQCCELTEAERAGGTSRAAARGVLQDLLECLAVFYRDLAASALAGQGAELFNRPFEERIRRLASRRSLDSIIESADLVFDAIESIGANANRRLALDDLFVGLAATAPGAPASPAPQASPQPSPRE